MQENVLIKLVKVKTSIKESVHCFSIRFNNYRVQHGDFNIIRGAGGGGLLASRPELDTLKIILHPPLLCRS